MNCSRDNDVLNSEYIQKFSFSHFKKAWSCQGHQTRSGLNDISRPSQKIRDGQAKFIDPLTGPGPVGGGPYIPEWL